MDREDAQLADELLEGAEGTDEVVEEDINVDDFFKPAEAQLTPREQALMQRLGQIEQQQAAEQQRQFANQHQTVLSEIQRLPPDQQQTAAYLYRTYLFAKQQENRAAQAENYARQLENSAVPLVKEKLLGGLSEKAKLERGILEKYATDPRTAQAVAAALVEYRKANNLSRRASAGVDNVPTAGAAGAQSGSRANGAVKSKYANTGDLEGFLRAGGLR
jgi:hypothetical protein